jgi:hypothetical protein
MTRPTFPIAAWNVPAKDMDKWKARGVTVLVGCGLEVSDTAAARVAWAAEAAKRDLWVVADFLGTVPPNTYAFLLPDEMDSKQAEPPNGKWNGLTPEQIKPKYDAFKALAPTMPVFMSLAGDHITVPNRLAYYRSIAPYCEIWSEDWYEFSTDPVHYAALHLKAQAVSVLKQADPNKPVWSWHETCWQNLKGRPAGRQVTQGEFAQSCRDTRAAGIAGRGHFSHVFNGNGGWVAFDGTPDDIAAEIVAQNQVDNPPVPAPPIETKDQEQDRRLKAIEDKWAASFKF